MGTEALWTRLRKRATHAVANRIAAAMEGRDSELRKISS
jgi:hypothetical protein